MISLFDYCFNKSALHKNYVQAVAEAWGLNKIKTLDDLDNYYIEQEKLMKIKKEIAKKLGKRNGLTQYEEAYIETWVNEYKYDLSIIEIALKRTTMRANPNFEYINNIIKDWNSRNLRTVAQVNNFLEQRKKQAKDTKELQKQVKKESFEQRAYSNLSFLYANKNLEGASNESK
jgi:DnaD/phage-associated family protein